MGSNPTGPTMSEEKPEETLGPVVISMTTFRLVRPVLKVVDGKLRKVGEVAVKNDEGS